MADVDNEQIDLLLHGGLDGDQARGLGRHIEKTPEWLDAFRRKLAFDERLGDMLSVCPPPEEMAALLDGMLEPTREPSLRAHIEHCPACRHEAELKAEGREAPAQLIRKAIAQFLGQGPGASQTRVKLVDEEKADPSKARERLQEQQEREARRRIEAEFRQRYPLRAFVDRHFVPCLAAALMIFLAGAITFLYSLFR